MFPTSTMGTLSLSFTLLICSLRRTHATEHVANAGRSVQTDDIIQQARLKTCGLFSFIICRQNNLVGVATLAGFCVCYTFYLWLPCLQRFIFTSQNIFGSVTKSTNDPTQIAETLSLSADIW